MFDVYVSSLDDHGYFQDHVECRACNFRKTGFHVYIDLIVDFILQLFTRNRIRIEKLSIEGYVIFEEAVQKIIILAFDCLK